MKLLFLYVFRCLATPQEHEADQMRPIHTHHCVPGCNCSPTKSNELGGDDEMRESGRELAALVRIPDETERRSSVVIGFEHV